MFQGTENLEAGGYGAVEPRKNIGGGKKKLYSASPILTLACIVMPWLIFAITYYVLSFFVRYWSPYAAYFLAFLTLLVCFGFAYMTRNAAAGKGGDPRWLGLLFSLSILAWIWAVVGASNNYSALMQPYFDLQQLNVYQSVDPSRAEGNQYMDFGVIQFLEKARIDRVFSMAFKNDDTYCVAPVKMNNTMPGTYDFWAVGINCCSSHLYDFRCGMWNDPAAHSGVRVVQESHKSFYQLAAKQAAAAFDIQVRHPIFFEWVVDPRYYIDRYQEAGFQNFIDGSLNFLFVEVVIIVVAAFGFAKMS